MELLNLENLIKAVPDSVRFLKYLPCPVISFKRQLA